MDDELLLSKGGEGVEMVTLGRDSFLAVIPLLELLLADPCKPDEMWLMLETVTI